MWPRNRARFDRREPKAAALISSDTSVSFEPGFERLVLMVVGVSVFAVSVGLPDFECGVRNRNAVAIQNSSLERNALTWNFWRS